MTGALVVTASAGQAIIGRIAGTAPTLVAGGATVAYFQNSGVVGDLARVSIISGNTGQSILQMGDNDDDDIGGFVYDQTANSMVIRTDNATRVTVSSAGLMTITGGLTVSAGGGDIRNATRNAASLTVRQTDADSVAVGVALRATSASGLSRDWGVRTNGAAQGNFELIEGASNGSDPWAGTVRFTIYSGGGVYIGASPSDPGANNLTVQGILYSDGGLDLNYNASIGASANGTKAYAAGTFTKTGSTGDLRGYESNVAITVNGAVTCDRAAQVFLNGITATVTGTLTNHNALYVGTPANGSTVKTIDTSSGGGTPAHLTTSGIWTDASSWAKDKDLKGTVTDKEVDGWIAWVTSDEAAAQYYRYPTVLYTPGERLPSPRQRSDEDGGTLPIEPEDWLATGVEVKKGGHQDYEHDSIFPLLDDMPESLRKAITTDTGGGVGGKDMTGALYAMLRRALQRITRLETRVVALSPV